VAIDKEKTKLLPAQVGHKWKGQIFVPGSPFCPERTLADYIEKKDYMINDQELKDDFVFAILADIDKKLDILISSQQNLLNSIHVLK
jgi:hypothetical protein